MTDDHAPALPDLTPPAPTCSQAPGQEWGQAPPAACGPGQFPNAAPPGETRICFPFLNRGYCNFNANCRFRHLTQDHPDSIADRVRTGHAAKTGLPAEQVQQVQQQLALQGVQVPAEGSAGGDGGSSSQRICFPFLNHGRCSHENCKFRHLAQDHVIAVRLVLPAFRPGIGEPVEAPDATTEG